MESCYIWFVISLEYPSAYVYSCCSGKIQNWGLSRGYINPILSHFCLFFEILLSSFTFFTLESCYIWLTFILEYPSAYVYSCCPGKIQNWFHQGVHKPFFSHFCLFSGIFCLFLQFFTLEFCYIWFTLSLEYSSAYVYSFVLVKFKIWVYLGVCKPCFDPYCPFSEIFSISSILYLESFWVHNAVCFKLVLAPSDLIACGLFSIIFG